VAIIIEDGSGVATANSYNTDAEYVAYAAARGISIGATATAREIELISGGDYTEQFLTAFILKTTTSQALRYPQSSSYASGVLVASTEIPKELKRAQLEAAVSKFKGDLDAASSASTTGDVKSQQLDTLKVEYYQSASSAAGIATEAAGSPTSEIYLDMLSVTASGSDSAFSFSRG